MDEFGPDHDKKYVVEVRVGDKALGRGEGRTKKNAEQEAAYQALLLMKKRGVALEGHADLVTREEICI